MPKMKEIKAAAWLPGDPTSFEQEMRNGQKGPHKPLQLISPFLPFLFIAYWVTRFILNKKGIYKSECPNE